MKRTFLVEILPFFTTIFFLLCLFFPKFPGNMMNWDNNPTALTPIALVRDHGFYFTAFDIGKKKLETFGTKADTGYFFFVTDKKEVLSSYPIFNGIFLTPVYILVSVFLPGLWQINTFPEVLLVRIGFVTAISVTVATGFVLHLLIRERTRSVLISLLGVGIFIFATSVLAVSSRFIWQHTFSLFFLSLMLWTYQKKRFSLVLLFSILSTVSRPTAIFICMPFLFHSTYLVYRKRRTYKIMRRDVIAILASLLVIATQMYYSITYLHNVLAFSPQYNIFETQQYNPDRFSGNIFMGVLGVLFSPGAGIFFYTPFFIFPIWHAIRALQKGKNPTYKVYLVALILFVLVTGKWRTWYGGWSLGYRLLLETVPLLIVLSGDFLRSHTFKTSVKTTLIILSLVASYILNTQITANFGECGFHGHPSNIDTLSLDNRAKRLWFDSPIWRCVRKIQRDTDVYTF